MARLTPAEITAIAEPLELVYQNMTDELLINIARHLKGGWDDTATWEMKKLGQLGALTKESAQIIAKYTGQTEEEITQTFLEAASLATADIDPVLAEAAAAGKLVDPGTTVATSPAMQSALRSYVEQATDKLNLTNTTMLESTRQAYSRTVHSTAEIARTELAQKILETQTAEVVTRQTSRTAAMRTALNQVREAGYTGLRRSLEELSEKGLAGFYDKAGRQWSPEAYVNMVIKTTAHNVAIDSIRTRQQEYGAGDIFQVSSHPGARPLCYPYQGKFYSWYSEGVWTDGAGNPHPYEYIGVTSYGLPAGLFGINCGHHPIPMVDGFSFPQDQEEQTPEENAKEYEESQKQRALERDIREAKREQEVLKAAGDEEGAKAAGAKVRREQARMREFIDETGRVRRYDRESIGGGTTPTMPKVAAPKPATPAPFKWNEPQGEIDKNFIARAEKAGVTRVKTTMMEAPLTTDQIITKLAGGDETKGSCLSLSYAYAGNRAGVDVRDFRGGKSCNFFAEREVGRKICELGGGTVIKDTNDFNAAHKLLDTVESGKEYILFVGRHGAIVRKSATGVEFLEMQSYSENGFFPLDDDVLKNRFDCKKSHSYSDWRGRHPWEWTNMLTPVDGLKDQATFRALLEFINTPENKQKKGASGGIR